jgi:hypothetical protein
VSECFSTLTLSVIVGVLPRERGSETDTCEGSIGRRLRLEPVLDATEEVRDNDCESRRVVSLQGDAPPMGDGRGVISPIAISCGDDK